MGDLVGAGLIGKGVVAFDVNYDLHETTLTGDLATDGRFVLQARNALQTTSEPPPTRSIESFEVSSWSFNSLEYSRDGTYPLPGFP